MAPDEACPIDEHSREVLQALQSAIATLIVGLQSEHHPDTGPRANITTPAAIIGADEPGGTLGTMAPCQTGVPGRIHREITHSLMRTIDRLIGMLERDGTSRSAKAPIEREPAQTDPNPFHLKS